MADSRTILVAGAGIGGLAAAIALARHGFRPVVLEQASRLEEVGAGIQLSPNATRVIGRLGLLDRITAHAVSPDAIQILTMRDQSIARIPLGRFAETRYGAPYLVIHRKDLQAELLNSAHANEDIDLRLGHRVDDVAIKPDGVIVRVSTGAEKTEVNARALIGADGLWSFVRQCLHSPSVPRFRNRTAWRTTVPAEHLPGEWRKPLVTLRLGPEAHVVHYPVNAGATVNIVAIVEDPWHGTGWNEPGERDELMRRFVRWTPGLREVLAIPKLWHKWALHDLAPLQSWGRGPVSLLGDAAHPVLPFLAQGAAMAIEDADVLASCLAESPDNPAAALRRYENLRTTRTARIQMASARNRRFFHLQGLAAAGRDLSLRLLGGPGLLRRFDWVYDWRP